MPSDQFHRVEKLTGESEDWILVGSTNDYNVVFQNSWANEGTAAARFYKDKFNNVHIAGVIDTGTTATTAFTMPVGYRPEYQYTFVTDHASSGGGHGGTNSKIVIGTDGTVKPTFGGGGGSTQTTLDGVMYRA